MRPPIRITSEINPPTMESNSVPELSDGKLLRLAACQKCGGVHIFHNKDEHNEFPLSGYWTFCMSCETYSMFYALDVVATVVRNEKSIDWYGKGYSYSRHKGKK